MSLWSNFHLWTSSRDQFPRPPLPLLSFCRPGPIDSALSVVATPESKCEWFSAFLCLQYCLVVRNEPSLGLDDGLLNLLTPSFRDGYRNIDELPYNTPMGCRI